VADDPHVLSNSSSSESVQPRKPSRRSRASSALSMACRWRANASTAWSKVMADTIAA
jgi:hypothetical protein